MTKRTGKDSDPPPPPSYDDGLSSPPAYGESTPPPYSAEVGGGGGSSGRQHSYRYQQQHSQPRDWDVNGSGSGSGNGSGNMNERTPLLGQSGHGQDQDQDHNQNQRGARYGYTTPSWFEPRMAQPQPHSPYSPPPPPHTVTIIRVRNHAGPRNRYTPFARPNLRQQFRRSRRNPCGGFFIVVLASLVAVWVVGEGLKWALGDVPELLPARKMKVAVVGAGPAGVGVAWALGGEFAGAEGRVGRKGTEGRTRVLGDVGVGARNWGRVGRVEVEITVFEKGAGVGGRMLLNTNATRASEAVKFGMQDVATSPLLRSRSVIVVKARAAFGEQWKADTDSRTRRVGSFDGDNMQVILPRPISRLSPWEQLRLWWRYGSSVTQARNIPAELMEGIQKFTTLRCSFRGISEMLQKTGLAGTVAKSAAETVKDSGIGDKYRDEVLQPQLMRQSGQELKEVSQLALAAALWRENQAEPVASGGKMEEALKLLLKASGAKLVLQTEVVGAKRRRTDAGFGDEKWDVKLAGPNQDIRYEVFDHIVVAAPLSEDTRERMGVKDDKVSYRAVWVTMVLTDGGGGLDTGIFGSGVDEVLLPISKSGKELLDGIREVSHVRDIYGPDDASNTNTQTHHTAATTASQNASTQAIHSLYRILSTTPIAESTLALIFGQQSAEEEQRVQIIHQQKIEKAWPLLWPRSLSEIADVGGFEVVRQGKGGREGGGNGDGKGKGEGEGLWCLGGYEGVIGGVDVAWAVGENLGRVIAGRIGGGR